jgi:choline dehydrogenase-like flavoprotein
MNLCSGNRADAIVVGAGLNGSWVAKELTSGGMKVILLDAGPILPTSVFSIDPFRTSLFDPRYHFFRFKLLLRGNTDQAFSKFVDRQTSKLFVDPHREPYVTPPGRKFSWFRVRAVGGRGHLWGRVILRVTDRQLTRPGYEWPVRYDDLASYYSQIEQLLEMGGAPSHSCEVPDGNYVHERSLNPLEEQFSDSITRRWPLRRPVVNHVAGYEPGPLSPMLQEALKTGRLILQPNKVVAALATDGPNSAVTGVTAVCTQSGTTETLRARYVILTASAFESVRILLNSRSERFPGGVGNRNGLVGTRILEHMTDGFLGSLPRSLRAIKSKYRHNPFKLNAEPHGFYIPAFASADEPEHLFGYGVQGTISTDVGIFYLAAFGETVPSDTNRLRLDTSRKDRFGMPVASIDFSWAPEDIRMWKEMNRVLTEMTEAFCSDSGIKLENPLTNRVYNMLAANKLPTAGSNHECGGARMGADPSTSVLDQYNRLWDAPNVLVCDTACFPSIPHQNPTLTSMALAVRASRQLVTNG